MIQEVSQATGLSAEVIRFCRENQVPEITANKVGVALEEMAVNTIEQTGRKRKNSYIDVRVMVEEDAVCISIRDNGPPYHPFHRERVQEEFDNISMVLAIADEAHYDNILGMNSSTIKLLKKEEKDL